MNFSSGFGMPDLTLEQQALIVQRVSERLVHLGYLEPGASAKECIAMADTTLGKVTELVLRLGDLRDEVFKTWPWRPLLRFVILPFVDWCPGIQRRPWARDL